MRITSEEAELAAALTAANAMCAAARTAPKACGIDHLDTLILTGEDKTALTSKMRELGQAMGERGSFFIRDAGNIDLARVIVLVGARYEMRGLGGMCSLCGFDSCASASEAGAACAFTAMDLGIALGSAVSIAADFRMDNRLMFTAGKAAAALGLMGEYTMIIGMPLSAFGKNIFFDRD